MPRITIIPLPSPCNPWHGVQKILYRSSPRCNNSAFTGSGNAFDSFATSIPSSSMALRATVPSISGRSDRPSAKDSDGSSGRYFGCNAMSCFRLQPASNEIQTAPHTMAIKRLDARTLIHLVIAHLTDMVRAHRLEKTRRVREIKLVIARLDAQEKAIRRGVLRKSFHVEEWMMRLRQSVQREHSKHRKKRRAQHRKFERYRNERRPAIQRPAADIQRIGNHIAPILEAESAKTSAEPADQRKQRHSVVSQAHRFGKAFHWERRVRVYPPISGVTGFLRSAQKLTLALKFPNHAINMGAMLVNHSWPSSDVCATSSRISAMEMAGSTRTNRNSNIVNKPSVPANVA